MDLASTPAAARLEWILGALGGAEPSADQLAEVMAPDCLSGIGPGVYVGSMRARVGAAAVTVVGLELAELTARAWVRSRAGRVLVVRCSVEPAPPHRIADMSMMDEIPGFVSPRLPQDFGPPDSRKPSSTARLVVLSGVPGTGKSALADALAEALAVPAFAGDWLLGALTPFGGYHLDNLLGIAEELLTTLALRQLATGQSAILDFPAERTDIRERWRSLAAAYGARLRPIVCICSDPSLHRKRAEARQRAIPGWHDAGDWTNIQRRIAEFPAWPGDVLTVDAIHPLNDNVVAALRYIRA